MPRREGSWWLLGQWALREGRTGGVAGRLEVLRSLRREAQRLAGAGGVAGVGAGDGDGRPSGSQRFWRCPRRWEIRRRWVGRTGVPAGIGQPKAEGFSVPRIAGGPAGGWWRSGPDNLGRFRQKGVSGPTCALSRQASLRSACGSSADRWAAGRKAWREWSFRHPLLVVAGSGGRPFPLAGGGGLVIPGPKSEESAGLVRAEGLEWALLTGR